jgi:hypothetical protein
MNLIPELFYKLKSTKPPYPPYNLGLDMEDTFINFYFKNKSKFDKLNYNFLPINWTTLFNEYEHLVNNLQQILINLPQDLKYFTLSQHDDAPYLRLPINTINFSAGGNAKNTICIPLISGPLPYQNLIQKNIFCSFVGSISQPTNRFGHIAKTVRMKMLDILVSKPEYVLKPKCWSPEVTKNRADLFLDITSRSIFTLCPRGYGATSFRLYEAMQLNSIPVYIYTDTPFLPYTDVINWGKLAVLVDYKNIEDLDDILKSIDSKTIQSMLDYAKEIYPKYFTLDSIGPNVLNMLRSSCGG